MRLAVDRSRSWKSARLSACVAAAALLFGGACSSRLSPARLARAFRPVPRPAEQAGPAGQRTLRAETAVDRLVKMQTQGAFEPLRDDPKLRGLRQAAQASPDNAMVRLQLARLLEGYGLSDQALEEYLSLLGARADAGADVPPAVLLGIARSGLLSGRAAEAVQAISSRPDVPPGAALSLRLGLLYDHLGQHARAEAAYRESLRLEPRSGTAHNNLGYSLLRQGDLEQAERHFRAAIASAESSAAARNNLGMLLARRGDYAGAWEQFQAGSGDPATARNNYAVALMSAGSWELSREQLLLALRERRGYEPALRNFAIVQQRIRSLGAGAGDHSAGN